MFSFKKTISLVALTAMLSFASACSSTADTCATNADCAPNQYCGASGGVFFESGQCLNRSDFDDPAMLDAAMHDDATLPNDADSDTVQDIEQDTEQDTDLVNPDANNTPPDHDADQQPDDDADQQPEDDAGQPPDYGTPTGESCSENTDCIHENAPDPIEVSSCTYLSTCAQAGTRVVKVQVHTCFEQLCYKKTEQRLDECVRDTNNTQCEEPIFEWDECQYENVCSQTAPVYGTKTTSYCENGTCSRQEIFELGNPTHCNRSTNGNSCVDGSKPSSCYAGVCQKVAIPVDPVEL